MKDEARAVEAKRVCPWRRAKRQGARKAIETLPKRPDGKSTVTPAILSDNGSCWNSTEFRVVLGENRPSHQRLQPHRPRRERSGETRDRVKEPCHPKGRGGC